MPVAGMRRVEPGSPYRASSYRSADVDAYHPERPPASNLTQTNGRRPARRPFLLSPRRLGPGAKAPGRGSPHACEPDDPDFRSLASPAAGLVSRRGGRVRYLHDRLMRGYAALSCESSRGGLGLTRWPRFVTLPGPMDLHREKDPEREYDSQDTGESLWPGPSSLRITNTASAG